MKIRHLVIMLSLILVLILNGCNNLQLNSNLPKTSSTLTPQITDTISSSYTTSQLEHTPTSTSLSLQMGDNSNAILIEPAYFEGAVVITQFFTLLDHGLVDELPQLMSSKMYDLNHGEMDPNIKSVKIDYLVPYAYDVAVREWTLAPNPENELRFSVGLTYFYHGAAWNKDGTPTPYHYVRFVALVLEDGIWKVDEINSSPWFPN